MTYYHTSLTASFTTTPTAIHHHTEKRCSSSSHSLTMPDGEDLERGDYMFSFLYPTPLLHPPGWYQVIHTSPYRHYSTQRVPTISSNNPHNTKHHIIGPPTDFHELAWEALHRPSICSRLPCSSTTTRSTSRSHCPKMLATDPTSLTPADMKILVQNKRLELRRGIIPPTDLNGRFSEENEAHEIARAIVAVSQDGMIQDFQNCFQSHRTEFPQPEDQWDTIMEKYFAEQCQNCKKRFSKHFILPMYPQPLPLSDSNTYLFCWACLQAPGTASYMIHPGPWLNTTAECETNNMTPIQDLNQLENRHGHSSP